MEHPTPPSILQSPSIQVELSTREAFATAYALGVYLARLSGPVTGLQEELAGLALYLRDRLPAQCRALLEAPGRHPLTAAG